MAARFRLSGAWRSIKAIDAPAVLKVLREVEARGRYESARRLRSTIGSVFRYAIATARVEVDPTFALQRGLIKPAVTPRAAITDSKAFDALLRAVESFDGQPGTLAALKLMVVLFPRPGELRAADWAEFDLDEAVWTVSAAGMKMRRPHRAPLSTQANRYPQAGPRDCGASSTPVPQHSDEHPPNGTQTQSSVSSPTSRTMMSAVPTLAANTGNGAWK
jgi:integrase